MNSWMTGKKFWAGCGLAGVALAFMLTAEGASGDSEPPIVAEDTTFAGGAYAPQADADPTPTRPGGQPMGIAQQGNDPDRDEALRALAGLAEIRQQQCRSGNQPACQSLPHMPAIEQQLVQLTQACGTGDADACGSRATLAQRIFTSYSESAAVMRAGEAGMAQMDSWRAGMNANAAASMANLQARAAAGQAAHNARQGSYADMNRSWNAGQESSDRNHGRFVDSIYGGTTMDGGGVQTRVPYGSTGYTDGNGNVMAVPNGGGAPDGWQEMDPTFAATQ